MDFENKYEAEVVFQVELEDKNHKKKIKTKKILKSARTNLSKLTIDRINGRTGEC